MKSFTIDQIKNYIMSQDSLGDVLYNLSEASIDKANQKKLDVAALQADYERITTFKGDFWKPLRDKYNLTQEELLANIDL